MAWSLKDMMQPVIARLFIYGMNPIELEHVFKTLEEVPLLNVLTLEQKWVELWETRAQKFRKRAEEAEEKGNLRSAKTFRKYVVQFDYAQFLINSNEIDFKKAIYERFERDYEKYTKYLSGKVEKVAIPFKEDKKLVGYLHLPKVVKEKYPCMILFPGEGSCKEELNTLAREFAARGIVALAWDGPGTGNSLFKESIKTGFDNLEQSFKTVFEWLKNIAYIDAARIGCCGLCMGGGYAYFASAHNTEIKCCINLFPLFMTQVDDTKIPRWMINSKWTNYQRDLEYAALMNEMKALEEGAVACSYLLVESMYENWMPQEAVTKLYDKAKGHKEMIRVEEEPVFSNGETRLHTMPVGEQMHWLKHAIADWAVEQFK